MAAAVREGIRTVIWQLQRIDAFLLNALYLNVQRMQERVQSMPPNAGSHTRDFGRNEQQHELPSWTADGFRKMDLSDVDVVALQVAPWTFLTSPYSYSLILMAILLNRIQHVISPAQSHRSRIVHSWFSWLFPINASATQTRFLLRSASIYLLWKSLLRMGIIVLQAFELYPSVEILAPLGRWASMTSMIDVCWSSFVAVCAGLAIGTFTRGLDGSHPPMSSFNLPQYAFLLHLYSSPLGSIFNRIADPFDGLKPASRPNRHVLMTMFLPLLQIALLHTQGIWKDYSRDVLIPTSICGIIGMSHFMYTLWTGQIMDYPLLQVVPSFLELFLAFMVFATMGINIISQVLQYGGLVRPLFAPGAGSLPARDEEFCLALVRLGTSSVDATSAAGLGNEVAPIPSHSRQGGTVRLGPSGVVFLEIPGQKKTNSRPRRSYAVSPFTREIKHVRAVSAESDMWINVAWLKELYRFAVTLWRFMKSMWTAIRARGRVEATSEDDIFSSPELPPGGDGVGSPGYQISDYSRFLAGEVISDDEESEYGQENDSDSGSDTESTGDGEDVDSSINLRATTPNRGEWEEQEMSQLYSEHGSQRATTPIAPVLLAHLTTSSGSPLTRRKYSAMLLNDDKYDGTAVHGVAVESPTASHHPTRGNLEAEDASPPRMCVICLCSERTVICWPCRCLSMCEDCRGNLASRNGPAKHSCPCCRQPVEGFSRIFIP